MMTLKNFAVFAIMMVSAAVFFASCSSASNDEPKNPVKQEAARGPLNFVIKYTLSDPNNEISEKDKGYMAMMFSVKQTERAASETEEGVEALKNRFVKQLQTKMKNAAKEVPSLKSSHVTVTYSYDYTHTINGKKTQKQDSKTLAFSDVDKF